MRPLHIVFVLVSLACFGALLYLLSYGSPFPLLFPSGSIGSAERDLMLHATFLMLIVVVPVWILAIFIGVHYRAENTKAKYTPDWEHSRMEEMIWWAIPLEIVLVLAALTWTSTHALDPAKEIQSSQSTEVVEVVALPWKWLFIYPKEGVASVNELAIPVGHPVHFSITADAPMNSFWIPALGGQEYAMTGMITYLHLMATKVGEYPGMSANYSGEGFAQMKFTARVMSDADFKAWVGQAQQSPGALTPQTYATLRQPSDAGPVRYYGMVQMTLNDIVHGAAPMMQMK